MADTHSKLVMLSLSVEGLRARIFTALKPAIDEIIRKFTEWAQSIDSATVISAAQAVGTALIAIMQSISSFVLGTLELIDKFKDSIGELARYAKDPIGAAATDARASRGT